MGAPPITEAGFVPRVPGAGTDLVVQSAAPGETVRLWIDGEAYPRIVLDIPNHAVLTGDGTIAPSALAPTANPAAFIRRDVVANRGAFGTAGTLFGATDTLIGYRDSGTSWDPFFPVLDGAGKVASSVLPTIPSTLAGLTDTNITAPANLDLLQFQTGDAKWHNVAAIAQANVTGLGTALGLKAPLASPTFTGTVTIPTGASIIAPTGLVKADVGLGNVDNTADAAKAFAGAQITSGTVNIARIPTGATGATVPFGNDARFTDARTPTAHAASHASGGGDPVTLAESQVTNLVTDLSLKAPLASPTFTGTVTVPTPVGATDAVNKAALDAAISGVASEPECKYATTAALPTVVYSNGSSGVGATLIAVGLGALSLDGNTPAVNDSVLVKNQVAQEQNGIYTVTTVGNAGVAFVLTRRTNFDQAAEIAGGDSVFVQAGTTNGNTTWVLSVSGAVVVGTTALPWVQTGGPGSVTAGTGISVAGNQVSIDTGTTVDKTTVQTLINKTLTSPALAGSPTAPTQTAGDNSTKLATTAYVDALGLGTLAIAFSSVTVPRRSLDRWRGATRPARTYLKTALSDTTGTAVVPGSQNFTRTGVRELGQIDSERMLILSGQASLALVVARGADGTTAATHLANAAIVTSGVRNTVGAGDSTAQCTTSSLTGSNGEQASWDGWQDRVRRVMNQRFGGSLGMGLLPMWRSSGSTVNGVVNGNTATEWAFTGTWSLANSGNVYDLSPWWSVYSTSGGSAVATRQPGEVWAQIDVLWIDTSGVANLWSYSVDGGSTWVANPNAAAAPASTTIGAGSNGATLPQATITVASTAGYPASGALYVQTTHGYETATYSAIGSGTTFTGCVGGTGTMATSNQVGVAKLRRSSIAVSNPTDFRLRCQTAGGSNSTSIFCAIDRWSTVPVFGTTTGVKHHNLGKDGDTLALMLRARTVGDLVTASSTTVTSNEAAFTTADTGHLIVGTNIPANTYLTYVSATQCTLSASATGSGTNPATIQGTLGDWARIFDGDPASLNPDLFICGPWTNDMSLQATTNGARTIIGPITSGTALQSISGNFYSTDTGKVVVGTGIPAATTMTYVDSTHATLSGTSTNSTALTSVTTTDAGDVFTKSSHGLTNTTPVTLTSIVSTTGISTGVVYYVIGATTNTFQLSTTVAGSAVTLTTDGSCTVTTCVSTVVGAFEATINAGIKNNLQTLISRIQPYCDILAIVPFEQGSVRLDGTQSTAAKQATYRAAMNTVLATNKVATIDVYAAWSAEGNVGNTAAAADGLIDTNDTSLYHEGQTGHNDMASRITRTAEIF